MNNHRLILSYYVKTQAKLVNISKLDLFENNCKTNQYKNT